MKLYSRPQLDSERANNIIEGAIESNLSTFYDSHERYLKAPIYLVGFPNQPLPDRQGQPVPVQGDGSTPPVFLPREETELDEFGLNPEAFRVSRGYFQHLTNMEEHVTFLEGRMATNEIEQGPEGPILEAMLGYDAADAFNLELGDEIVLTPSVGLRERITAKIVGLLEPIDPTERYWQNNTGIFFNPQPLAEDPDPGVEVEPTEPPLSIFLDEEMLLRGVGDTYVGTLVSYSWFVFVDKEGLKNRPVTELTANVANYENQIASEIQGSAVFTGIRRLSADFATRNFFTSVPLLLLISVMVITVLYYLGMMVGYLVQSRENDVALLRSRGIQ